MPYTSRCKISCYYFFTNNNIFHLFIVKTSIKSPRPNYCFKCRRWYINFTYYFTL